MYMCFSTNSVQEAYPLVVSEHSLKVLLSSQYQEGTQNLNIVLKRVTISLVHAHYEYLAAHHCYNNIIHVPAPQPLN